MRFLKQLGLLLWKNYLLQKRKVLVTFVELAIPAFFALILILIRQQVQAKPVDIPTKWDQFPVDHLLPYFCPIPHMCFIKWKIYYSPKNEVTDRLMTRARSIMGSDSHVSGIVGFDNETSLVDQFLEDYQLPFGECTTLGGIIFTNDTIHSQKIQYKIRLPYTPRSGNDDFHLDPLDDDSSWHTQFMFPDFQKVGPRERNMTYSDHPGYFQDGFLTLQYAVDRAILLELNPSAENISIQTSLQRNPYPPYNDDPFVLVLQTQFPFIIILSFVFTSLQIVKDVVHEKERILKESMKMMGLNNWLHWSAWFIKYLLFLMISMVFMTICLCVSAGQYGSVIGYTSWSVLLVYLILYSIATINFCFAVSVFFSKANSGAAAGGIMFFISYMPYSFLQKRYQMLSLSAKLSTCIFSNVAMAFGAQIIGMFEGTGAGIQWSTINQGASVDDNFTMLDVFVMLIFDAVLYGAVAWYVETVWPGEFGVPKPWYFPFMKSYWCGYTYNDYSSENEPLLTASTSQSEFTESDPTNLRPGIQVTGLRKMFKSGKQEKMAVDEMTVNMYEGQITALLGHNGAGKTTTISMLTGLFPPSSGKALVNGYCIGREIARVRQSLGLCPQHNVLFDSLTVEEHLVFFAKLKGCTGDIVTQEVDKLLQTLGLQHKRHTQSKVLSGGMKRKLSVGIALIGGSKIVILDEPTSGMDPNARRQMWNILLEQRAGRTILLTTHFMDEADVLGDRIAIMAEGVIQCSGSPLFLKKKYGAGYHLIMVKESACDVNIITSVVQHHVPDATLESNVSAELSFILPHENKAQFVALFDELEMRKSELKIASYGASVTTMEEVFLRVGETESSRDRLQNKLTSSYGSIQHNDSSAALLRESKKNSGFGLYNQQLRAMFVKRVLHTFRNWLITLTQLFVPLFFTIMALIVIKTMPQPQDSPPLVLNTSHFGPNHVLYSEGVRPTHLSEDLGTLYAEQFKGTTSKPSLVNFSRTDNISSLEDYLAFVGMHNIPSYTIEYQIALELNANERQPKDLKANAFFNAQAFHTAPMTLNALHNGILKYFTNASYSISTVNHPFPRTVDNQIQDQLTLGFEGFAIAVNVVFGMAFLASSFVLFLIKERTIKAKHSQFVSGVRSWTFWAATFSWDLINYAIPCFLLIVTFACFGVHAFVESGRFLDILLLFLLYGWAVLPVMYLMSFLFTVPASGFVWLSMFNIISGIATILTVDILRIPGLHTENVAKILEWVFIAILPNFCLGQGLSDFYSNNQFLKICTNPYVQMLCASNTSNPCCKGNCGEFCLDYTENYLSWQPGGIGRMLIFLTIQGFVYFSVLFLLESQAFQWMWYGLRPQNVTHDSEPSDSGELVPEDGDVAAERRRLVSTDTAQLIQSETLVLQELTKYYDSLLAVDRLSFGIPQGECFGLLGINGAGKTSTFKMLTGDEIVSSGNAFINGLSIRKNIDKVRRQLGYCPQFDALIDELTGRETLIMYARLRGVLENLIPETVENLLHKLLLEQHADKLVKEYSGGNKRKLSTAVALIGDPPVVFLDEPSTGMDPLARRLLWDTLSEIRSNGRTLILTSHSMEECEALCTKIAILVNGQTKCLGSTQHLKNKFGEGFMIIAKVAPSAGFREPDTRPLTEHIQQTFPGSILKDVHQGMVHFHITDTTLKWAELFSTMERAKEDYDLEDYSVSQTSLEQVFITFARSQIPPQENQKGCCKSCCMACKMCLCRCQNGQQVTVESECDESIPV